jgi:NDP-sugar pyrophosphorylase family protein
VASGRLAGVPTRDYWIDAGRPEPFLEANLDLIRGVRGAPPVAVHDGAAVDDRAALVESVVGDRATVAAGASIAHSVLLPGASVGPGASVDSSIVAGHVGAGATVRRSVIGPTFSVASDDVVVDQRLPTPE